MGELQHVGASTGVQYSATCNKTWGDIPQDCGKQRIHVMIRYRLRKPVYNQLQSCHHHETPPMAPCSWSIYICPILTLYCLLIRPHISLDLHPRLQSLYRFLINRVCTLVVLDEKFKCRGRQHCDPASVLLHLTEHFEVQSKPPAALRRQLQVLSKDTSTGYASTEMLHHL